MFIPDSLRNYMIEPDVSNYLQAPSSSQVCVCVLFLLLIHMHYVCILIYNFCVPIRFKLLLFLIPAVLLYTYYSIT